MQAACAEKTFPAVEGDAMTRIEQLRGNDLPVPGGEGEWFCADHLPGSSFTQNQDTRGGNTCRREQVNKTYLLLQWAYHNRITFAVSANAVYIAGKLKQYSPFLFPYHFFW